ncbi:putative baseplate assembly protein [Rhodocaloribacter sp.]
MATTDTRTDTCGCCDDASEAPRHENRPGLSALDYRIGTHGSFLRRMLERIGRIEIPDGDHAGERPLAKLTTRAPDDPAVALLDAWAAVADVLTFYQERIANEGFLRTATERRSLLELARAIGYELNPGVAASAWLAFHVNEGTGSPEQARIPTGTKAQSIPAASDEMPQTFETTEDFEAHAAWNAVAPRLTETHVPVFGETEVFIEGVAHQVQPGDHLLFVGDERKAWYGSERWDVRKVKTVELFPEEDRTRLTWDLGLGAEEPHVEPPAGNVELFVFRRRAALFGHNAPDWRAMPEEIKRAYCEDLDADGNPTCPDWPDFEINVDDARVDLDADYPKVLPGSWMALVEPNYIELYRAVEVAALTRTDFTLSTKITRVTVDIRENLRLFGLRETLALIESEALTLAERPLTAPVSGDAFDVSPLDPPFAEGQTIIVTGKLSEEDEDTVSETAVVKAVTDHGTHQTVTLEEALANAYVRTTVTIYGNVVPGTHGETVNEVLGGGDGSKQNQTFTLKKKPLTYVSAATASGTESTLVIRVNGVRWDEAPSLYEAGPEDTVYTVRINDDAEATVIFGDGVHGARLPTGQENVTAAYRAGLGLDGEVDAGQLSLLMTRPYGIDGVNNPLPAGGGADPETTEEARTNAPRTVLTLDRIVSLRDFEDFARGFTGIGKAQATPIFNGEAYLVHLTLADVTGDAVVSPLLDNLRAALDDARDPSAEVVLASADTRTFRLEATILYDPAYVPENLQSGAETALRDAFSFDARAFAQPVTAAEILRVLHDLDGVVAVDLDALYLDDVGGGFSAVLPAERARREDGALLPAQILILHDDAITLTMRAA